MRARSPKSRKPATVADLHAALDALAPFAHAADWDNVGLLAGWRDAPTRRVLLAIDLTDAVAREALRARVDTLVLYHPPIFKGIRTITAAAEAPTGLLPDLLAARVSILALHTALDVAVGGTNDILLEPFDLAESHPLELRTEADTQYKLIVFVPAASVAPLRTALAEAGAGQIGHYGECSFELAGRGTFRGDATTHPAIGSRQVLEHVDETRLEMIVPRHRVGPVVRVLYAHHPYEEPAFDLLPLHNLTGRGQVGLGRVGLLRRPTRGTQLVAQLRGHVDLSGASVVGALTRRFRAVTAAAGSFGVRSFRDPDALVLTGEFKHHDALELLRRGITAVHLGHYASERPALTRLRQHLAAACPGVRFTLARSDSAPFQPLAR